MFDTKVISILAIILFLLTGCKEPTTVEGADATGNLNTLNSPDLGAGSSLDNYWYHLNDEGIEAQFLYYNANITQGLNTIIYQNLLNPYKDTLYFRTFPSYTVEINGAPQSISYMLSLTPENVDSFSTLYLLDETNPDALDWCNEMLVEYEGNCPDDAVEVNFDFSIIQSSSTGKIEDRDTSQAVFNGLLSKKIANFSVAWRNIDSLVWNSAQERYDLALVDSAESLASTIIDTSDYFDSLIYVGIIDTLRYPVEDLMFIDRTEWERYDTTKYKNSFKSITLADTFIYSKTQIPEDSPIFRINGDCNQNLIWDSAETFYDYGPDMCPDSLETGPDTYDDIDGNGIWDEGTDPLIIDWNADGKWTKGFCAVVDTDSLGESGYGEILDEEPCNCLGDWRGGYDINGDLIENDVVGTLIAQGYDYNWVSGSIADPNGDNWNDCGWDGICPGYEGDYIGDENGSEGNGSWDINEGFEENGEYNLDFIYGFSEYFVDKGNGFPQEPAEYCVTGNDGECDGNDLFEDRNCNGKWDDRESGDEGNGIWDDNEKYLDTNGISGWQAGEPLYEVSNMMNTLIIDYSDHAHPKHITTLDSVTQVTLLYGTTGPTAGLGDSIYVLYDNFLIIDTITAVYSESFYDIDSIVTTYTNKIIDYPIPGIANDYQITKTKWFQDMVSTTFNENDLDNPEYGYAILDTSTIPNEILGNYGYDYHLFKTAENGDIINMVHPAYFYYYGYFESFDELELGSWKDDLSEEIYIYTYNGELRSGEYYFTDTTIVTDIADYYVEKLYQVVFDPLVSVPFAKVTYNIDDSGIPVSCKNTDDTDFAYDPPYVNITIANDYIQNCPPVDTILTNTYKITRTKTITMIGSGVELGLRNTVWLGTEEVAPGEFNPLGIVKDQLEVRWSEPYWEEYGSGWNVISLLKLRSLSKTESESSILSRIFQPTKHLSLDELHDVENFNNEPYVVNSSYGIHRMRQPHEK